ncbi:histone-fold-containing protein, partial [Suhomyces tanzawaensis NRRL Y-17324]
MSSYSESVDNESVSDISLDEDDEELIWRVFYNDLDRKTGLLDQSTQDIEDHNNYYEEDEDEDIEDVSDLSDIEDSELAQRYRELRETKIDKDMPEEEKKRLLISHFSEDQMERFEAYRRMTINKPGVKKICNSVLGQSIPQNLAVVLAGISKLFLGEIITKAFEVQERENRSKLIIDIDEKKKQKLAVLKSLEQGKEVNVDDKSKKLQYGGDVAKPLQPNHIVEAYRLYKMENSGAFESQWRREGEVDGKGL